MLYSNASELKQYLFKNPDQLVNPMFVLAHAPYCAKHMIDKDNGDIFKECLQKMFENHPYTIPFYYIGVLRAKASNASAGECKEFLRSMCDDLDKLIPWYKQLASIDEKFIDIIKEKMIIYIKNFISSVRYKQREIGANESVMTNYAPIIPYSSTMSRDEEMKASQEASNMSVLLNNCVENYSNIYCYEKDRFSFLSNIALNNANSIIDNIDIIFQDWKCPMDIFNTFILKRRIGTNEEITCDAKRDTLIYLMYVWLMNQDAIPTPEEISNQFNDFNTFRSHSMNPLKENQLTALFESMCKYTTGDIKDMMTVEAWTALSEDSQEYANSFLEHVTKETPNDIYNLDDLLSEFYTMRHVQTNDYTNQFFLANYPGITINSYNYIDDNIMVCEVNDKYLAIPYTDIAADYKMRLITIDKNHDIKIWSEEDMEELNNI